MHQHASFCIHFHVRLYIVMQKTRLRSKEYRFRHQLHSMVILHSALKLQIELVPSTTWYNNLRKEIPKEKWDALRRKVYSRYGYRCGICKAQGRMNCHELWSFDEKRHIQTLNGFISLCDMCHHVKHIGLAGILASRGELDYEKVIGHFMKVNGCGRNVFEAHRDEAFAEWKERSKHQWKVVVGNFEKADDAPHQAGTQTNLLG